MFPKFVRKLMTSSTKRSYPGIPGENLPFDIDNKFKTTALFILYFGSGLALPAVVLKFMMTKQ